MCALFIGFVIAAEARFAFMRVTDITLDRRGILPQYAVWGIIDPEHESFWPKLWLARKDYENVIEAYYPVDAKLSLSGWGKFTLSVEPLTPLFKVHWGDKFWYLSESGKLWLTSLPENRILSDHTAEQRPVLSWGADRSTPIDLSQVHGNIYRSSLPIPLIKNWYAMSEQLGWSKAVKFIQAGVIEDRPIVRIIFYTSGGGSGGQLLLPNESDNWPQTGLAVRKLYGGIANLPPDVLIDGTYKDKILIRNIKRPAEAAASDDKKPEEKADKDKKQNKKP